MTAPAIVARRPLVLADLVPGTLVRDVALVVGGAAFVGALAQLSFPVPGTPVPVTGQTFGVLLGGAALGWRRALPSMALYLLASLVGVPWLAGHHTGSLHLVSLGYVVSYVVAGPLVGWLAARGNDRSPVATFGLMLLGSAVIYAIGAPWLAVAAHLSGSQALAEGVTPFLLGDALKAAIAAGLLPATWRLVAPKAQHRSGPPL